MPRSGIWSSDAVSEPTLGEAFLKIKGWALPAGMAVLTSLGGGGAVYEWFQVQQANATAAELVKFYAPALGTCTIEKAEQQNLCIERIDSQKATCLQLLENAREDTAHWRAQCGGP